MNDVWNLGTRWDHFRSVYICKGEVGLRTQSWVQINLSRRGREPTIKLRCCSGDIRKSEQGALKVNWKIYRRKWLTVLNAKNLGQCYQLAYW